MKFRPARGAAQPRRPFHLNLRSERGRIIPAKQIAGDRLEREIAPSRLLVNRRGKEKFELAGTRRVWSAMLCHREILDWRRQSVALQCRAMGCCLPAALQDPFERSDRLLDFLRGRFFA